MMNGKKWIFYLTSILFLISITLNIDLDIQLNGGNLAFNVLTATPLGIFIVACYVDSHHVIDVFNRNLFFSFKLYNISFSWKPSKPVVGFSFAECFLFREVLIGFALSRKV